MRKILQNHTIVYMFGFMFFMSVTQQLVGHLTKEGDYD